MTMKTSKAATILALTLAGGLWGCSNSSNNNSSQVAEDAVVTASCDAAAPKALQMCIDSISSAVGACYSDGDTACDGSNADVLDAQAALQGMVEESCSDGDFMGLPVDATVG